MAPHTQGSKAGHNQEALSATDEIDEFSSWKLGYAADDRRHDGSGTSQGKQLKRRSDIILQVELNLLLHGDHEEHQEDAVNSASDCTDRRCWYHIK